MERVMLRNEVQCQRREANGEEVAGSEEMHGEEEWQGPTKRSTPDLTAGATAKGQGSREEGKGEKDKKREGGKMCTHVKGLIYVTDMFILAKETHAVAFENDNVYLCKAADLNSLHRK